MKLSQTQPRLFSHRKTALYGVFCATALFTASFLQAQTEPKGQDVPANPRVSSAGEDRDALLARLTKILNYGSERGYMRPGKTEAVIALGLIGDERSVSVLAEHLQNEESESLRIKIVLALGWIKGDKAIAALEQSLKEGTPYVRRQAADVLKQITGRMYEYDRTGLPEVDGRSSLEAPTAMDAARLEVIANEVARRREVREAQSGVTTAKKKMTEPVDMVVNNLPVGAVAKLYSDLTGRPVFASPKISSVVVSCKIEKATLAEAKATLEKALAAAGVQVVELEHGFFAFTPASATKKAETPAKP